MKQTVYYDSPLGRIGLSATDEGLTALWFCNGQEEFAGQGPHDCPPCPVLSSALRWLATYFSGRDPGFLPPLAPSGTPFRRQVWRLLLQVPFGQTTTYGALAREVASLMGKSRMSAQAIGQAVGSNPLAIIIPCHRVIGSDGSLTGYAWGLDKKAFLLEMEGIHPSLGSSRPK